MKIGLLTSGGDCQALNAAMRSVVKTILNPVNTIIHSEIAIQIIISPFMS